MSSGRAARGPARLATLIKGGHLEARPPSDESETGAPADEATDALYDGCEFHIFRAPRIMTRNTHGTGCALSSAIAASLARGCEIPEAVARAKQYVSMAMRGAPDVGHGAGPLNHFSEFTIGSLDQRTMDQH
jgi:hydroxymethylpyrimidine/phosphomethylpyrimidine kinase